MQPIFFQVKDNIGFITLNRPDKLNSFNREMALLLQKTLDDCKSKEIRCVYITGAGKGFSAGQDLAEVTGTNTTGFNVIVSEQYNPIVRRIRQLEKPVLAVVTGVAAGAGANIALCCDIVIASRSAYFVQAFSRIGLVPDSAGTYILPRLVGWQKASAWMMLGEKITAEEAEHAGMLYKVFPDDHCNEEALKIARTLAGMPTQGLAYTKKLLNLSVNNTFEAQLQEEELFQQHAAQTADFREGVQAFLEKRTPRFKGE